MSLLFRLRCWWYRFCPEHGNDLLRRGCEICNEEYRIKRAAIRDSIRRELPEKP